MGKRKSGLPFVLNANLAESKTIDLSRWKIEPLPIGKRLEEANHSGNNWKFEVRENQLLVVQDNSRDKSKNILPFSDELFIKNLIWIGGRRSLKKVKDGFLIGFDEGEFGGRLVYVSDDESEVYALGEDLRIKAFFEIDSKIYATEGLSHMTIRRGQIIEIYKNNVWTYKTVVQLNETPLLMEKLEDHFAIVTDSNLLKLTKNLEIERILPAPFNWSVLYPTSIYVSDENFYIAMRKGILKIENYQTKPAFEWYVPK